jgi:ribonucleoside-diphosphate reductase beta chain
MMQEPERSTYIPDSVFKKTRSQTKKSTPTYDYPAAVLAAEAQMDIMWLPTEPKVEKDLHCIKTVLTKPQLHGVMTTLKLFTLYEQVAGNEYWGGRFKRMFPRPDFLRMGSAFANTEINVHSPFYQRIDELLGLNTDEFYSSFTEEPVLKARMDFLDDAISDKDDLKSIATFSLVEGAILYSSFAYLMSYQSPGHNLLANMHAGLTFSVKDENLHSEGGAWAFRNLLAEKMELGLISKPEIMKLKHSIQDAATQIYVHESKIIDMIYTEGDEGHPVTANDLRSFVRHRINLGLSQLDMEPIFDTRKSPIEIWFYEMIGGDIQHDFFAKIGSSYNRNWSRSDFRWVIGGLNGRTWEECNE